jgi:membrane protein YdbS with pleckstrin-like domain
MSRSKQHKNTATQHRRRLANDLAFSRVVLLASLVFFVVVVVADVLYIVCMPRHGGHLVLPALVFAAPMVAVLFVFLTLWNWRSFRRRLTTRPNDHGDNKSLR